MLVFIGLALGFYFTTQRYEYYLQRSSFAHNVLDSYLAVSNHVFKKLSAMAEIVAVGYISDQQARVVNMQSLRLEVAEIRQVVNTEINLVKGSLEGDTLDSELARLSEIEMLVEKIIKSSDEIKAHVNIGQLSAAAAELDRLQSHSIAGHFNDMIEAALLRAGNDADAIDSKTYRMGALITRILPTITLIVMLLVLPMTMFFYRRLENSVDILLHGAGRFTAGDLEHRIPVEGEQEFIQLAAGFNTMAEELRSHQNTLVSANTKLAKIDQNRRQLLADISHELKTPLTVIVGESDVALRRNKQSEAEYRQALSRILEMAEHTGRLVSDLLFVARSDAGQMPLQLQPLSIDKLVSKVVDSFAVSAKQKRIDLVLKCGVDDQIVQGDSGRLRQVLGILLDNALRYSAADGKVIVKLENSEQDAVKISVIDDGIGLSKEDAALAFERFYRSGEAERYADGTGLGLTVAKAIVDAHSGQIWLEGQLGEGTQAYIVLPSRLNDHLGAVA